MVKHFFFHLRGQNFSLSFLSLSLSDPVSVSLNRMPILKNYLLYWQYNSMDIIWFFCIDGGREYLPHVNEVYLQHPLEVKGIYMI